MTMRAATLALVACAFVLAPPSALTQDANLPPDILVDQYLLEAVDALEAGDALEAFRAFEKIEALDIEPPSEFSYFFGKFLVEHGHTSGVLLKGEQMLKSFVIGAKKDSQHYRPALKLLTEARRKLDEIAEREAEEQRLRAAEQARLQKMAEEKALLAEAGCPEITGRYEHPETEGYMKEIRWDRGSDPISYTFERDDSLFASYRSPPYNVLVDRSIRRTWRDVNDMYRADKLEVVFQAVCESGKLVVTRKHNYATNWIVAYPYTETYTYESHSGGNLQVRRQVVWDPREGNENFETTTIWPSVP